MMTSKPTKARRTARAFILALSSCLALTAAMASTASALSFKDPTIPEKFSVSGPGGLGTFDQTSSYAVGCEGETTGSGTITEATSGTVTLTFNKCYLQNWSKSYCSSPIKTEPLSMDLVKLPEEKFGMVLNPVSSNVFAKFDCGLGTTVWTGGLIGELTDRAIGSTFHSFHLGFSATAAGQQFTHTASGREAILKNSVNGSTPKQMGLNMHSGLTLTLSEAGHELNLSEGEGSPNIEPLSGEFPHSGLFTVSNNEVTIAGLSSFNVKCKASGEGLESWALDGGASFPSSSWGSASFSFHHCRDASFNSLCTTAGKPTGTIATETLPTKLTYLAGGSPGIVFGSPGTVSSFSCLGGLAVVKITGSGMLKEITSPGLGETASGLKIGDVGTNETESGEVFSLQGSVNGAASKPVTINFGAPEFVGFGEKVELRE